MIVSFLKMMGPLPGVIACDWVLSKIIAPKVVTIFEMSISCFHGILNFFGRQNRKQHR